MHGNQIDVVFPSLFRLIQSFPDFLLQGTYLVDRVRRQKCQEEMRVINSFLDTKLWNFSGKDVFRIHPGFETHSEQFLVDILYLFFILLRIAKKNLSHCLPPFGCPCAFLSLMPGQLFEGVGRARLQASNGDGFGFKAHTLLQ